METTDIIPPALLAYAPLVMAILKALAIFIAGWIASKWAYSTTVKVIESRKLDLALGRFIGNIARYSVFAATVIAALGAVGIQTTSLVAIFASAGLAVGLALQGSLANFASGVMILFFRPFDLGDVVSAGGEMGRITDIGIFASTLETPSQKKIVVPNSAITGGTITNYTHSGKWRLEIDVGVAYGADINTVAAILTKAAATEPIVMAEPAPAAAFVGLGASSLDFKVLCYCERMGDADALQHGVRRACYDTLNAAGIEIPFNQIVVHKA